MGIFSRKKNKVSKSEMFFRPFSTSTPIVLYNYNQEDFVLKGYSKNAEVFRIIKKITDKANIATPYIYIDKSGAKSAKKSILDTPEKVAKRRLYVHKELTYASDSSDLSKLLINPNPDQTWRELITLTRIFYFVQGESFLRKTTGDDG